METSETNGVDDINHLKEVVEEHIIMYTNIRDEADAMQQYIQNIEAQMEEIRKENEILKEKIDENSCRESDIMSHLMKICSDRENTILSTIWLLTKVNQSVSEVLMKDKKFIKLLIEILRIEVVQDVLMPVLGILGNMCYYDVIRKEIGPNIIPYLFETRLNPNNQTILAALIRNLTYDKNITATFIQNYPFFEKLEEFLRSKSCFQDGEKILENTISSLIKLEVVDNYTDILLQLAKKYQLSRRLKSKIGSLVVGEDI